MPISDYTVRAINSGVSKARRLIHAGELTAEKLQNSPNMQQFTNQMTPNASTFTLDKAQEAYDENADSLQDKMNNLKKPFTKKAFVSVVSNYLKQPGSIKNLAVLGAGGAAGTYIGSKLYDHQVKDMEKAYEEAYADAYKPKQPLIPTPATNTPTPTLAETLNVNNNVGG